MNHCYLFVTVCTSGANVNAQADDLATALLISSQEGHQACVDLLLDNGADPNIACSRDWFQLAIHAAAQFGHLGYKHYQYCHGVASTYCSDIILL